MAIIDMKSDQFTVVFDFLINEVFIDHVTNIS